MIIALNNKSNLNKVEYLTYQEKLKNIKANSKLILCPTFLNINLFDLNNFCLGSQNVSSEKCGAHTGEISAEDLKNSNVEYAIVGHSERRQSQKESLEEINQKIKRLFENNITPILCIGETREERENKEFKKVLEKELITATNALDENQKSRIIIAYEPIWSIGTGIIPTNEEIIEVFNFIKTILPNNKILYGGSANEKNIDTLKLIKEIDGYLLGGLSLKTDELQIFINKIEN